MELTVDVLAVEVDGGAVLEGGGWAPEDFGDRVAGGFGGRFGGIVGRHGVPLSEC